MSCNNCMHWTRLPFCTEVSFWAVEAKRVALLRPEKAVTEVESEVDTSEGSGGHHGGSSNDGSHGSQAEMLTNRGAMQWERNADARRDGKCLKF